MICAILTIGNKFGVVYADTRGTYPVPVDGIFGVHFKSAENAIKSAEKAGLRPEIVGDFWEIVHYAERVS